MIFTRRRPANLTARSDAESSFPVAGRVVELVYTYDSKSYGAIHEGSTPSSPTNGEWPVLAAVKIQSSVDESTPIEYSNREAITLRFLF